MFVAGNIGCDRDTKLLEGGIRVETVRRYDRCYIVDKEDTHHNLARSSGEHQEGTQGGWH